MYNVDRSESKINHKNTFKTLQVSKTKPLKKNQLYCSTFRGFSVWIGLRHLKIGVLWSLHCFLGNFPEVFIALRSSNCIKNQGGHSWRCLLPIWCAGMPLELFECCILGKFPWWHGSLRSMLLLSGCKKLCLGITYNRESCKNEEFWV